MRLATALQCSTVLSLALAACQTAPPIATTPPAKPTPTITTPPTTIPALTSTAPNSLLALKTRGNQILNSNDQPVRLTGVNCASLEWTSNGEGHILKTVAAAIDLWKVNCIRLPLAQDRWFGKAPEQRDAGVAYRALVDSVVKLCESKNCYIILDLHWSDCAEWGTNIGQHSMPDEYSTAFWKDFAPLYANHHAVIFDLYNEPHDITWDIWQNGGQVTDKPNTRGAPVRTFQAVGMQTLLDTVRAAGAKNVVLAGGLDWSYDLSGILSGHQLKDPSGNGIIYVNHAYNNKGDSAYVWVDKMEKASAVLPVIVSEFGGASPAAGGRGAPPAAPGVTRDDWLLHVIQALEDHKWSFTAWDLHTSAGPTLISDWNYTPTANFGIFVKQELAGTLAIYTPPPRPAAARPTAP